MADLLLDIADTADELTNPMRIVETVWLDRRRGDRKRRRALWTVTLPSMLDQLAAAVMPGESYISDETTHSALASRPAARLDAVDRLLAIEAGAASWCLRLALSLRKEPASNIRALVGASATMASGDQRLLAADLRSWRIWAATVTGWEQPPHAPRAPCPLCDQPASLRIRLERETGCCLACGGAWDATNIGLLTAHITAYQTRVAAISAAIRAQAVATRLERVLPVGWQPRPDLPYVPW
jgi:hypothetical protein